MYFTLSVEELIYLLFVKPTVTTATYKVTSVFIVLQEVILGTRGIGYCSLGLLMSSSVWCRKS